MPLEVVGFNANKLQAIVLILVLMECLKMEVTRPEAVLLYSLNPCYNGILIKG